MARKLALRSSFLITISVILLAVISIFKIPSFLVRSELEDLGFKKEAVDKIIDLKVSKDVIDHKLNADNLNSAILEKDFDVKYLYLESYKKDPSSLDYDLYDFLKNHDYSEEELAKLFGDLEDYEIAPLVVFERVNVDAYISDCLSHKSENSSNRLTLSGDYLKPYENVKDAPKEGTIEVLVSPKFALKSNTPDNLEEMSVQYAIDGLILKKEAAEAFKEMCEDLNDAGLGIYAIKGYSPGSEDDKTSLNFNEYSTGLLVEVVDITNENVKDFKSSKEAAWLKENAHKYGFILRYPEGFEKVTGYDGQSNVYRYVGKDLATKIYESGLLMEEYCLLYA